MPYFSLNAECNFPCHFVSHFHVASWTFQLSTELITFFSSVLYPNMAIVMCTILTLIKLFVQVVINVNQNFIFRSDKSQL